MNAYTRRFDNWGSVTPSQKLPITIALGATLNIPNRTNPDFLNMPSIMGTGEAICASFLQFDVDNTAGTAPVTLFPGIGVSNGSEFDCPMWPYVGIIYRDNTKPIIIAPGTRYTFTTERRDIVSPDLWPAGRTVESWPQWVMNPGLNGMQFGRGYPSLCASIVNASPVAVTVDEILFYAEMVE